MAKRRPLVWHSAGKRNARATSALRPFAERVETISADARPRGLIIKIAENPRLNIVYSRTKEVAPAAVAWTKSFLETHKPGERLVFIGRSARPLYAMARRLAPYAGVNPREIVLVDVNRGMMNSAFTGNAEPLQAYLRETIEPRKASGLTLVDAFQGSGSTFRDLTLLLESLVTPGTPIKTNPLSRAGNQASKNLASILAEFDEGGLFGFRVSPHNIEMPGRLRRLKASNKNAGRTFPKYRRVANESEKADAWAVAQALQDSTREEIARLEATRATAGKPPVPKPAWKR